MAETYIHQLSMQNAAWLSARQAAIASNVANANTPGYKTQDVRPFAESLEQTSLNPTLSDASHLASYSTLSSQLHQAGESAWETYHSGGNVNLEHEMIKASEVSADYRLNTSIVRTFHRFFLNVTGS